jgi:hypothetical protein
MCRALHWRSWQGGSPSTGVFLILLVFACGRRPDDRPGAGPSALVRRTGPTVGPAVNN